MQPYEVPMVPGPTAVGPHVLAAYAADYGSADLEDEFFALYARVQNTLRRILSTANQVSIMSGEGMLALWAALRSCLQPGDRVLAISSGPFGEGIADMASSLGAEVELVEFPFERTADPDTVGDSIARVRPKMVTLVHCETPCGTLNPVAQIGGLVRRYEVPLFFVDAVASAGGAELRTDDWRVDLCALASQKCLSAPPGLAILSVSQAAWRIVEDVKYEGYDALLPWRDALQERYFPYTHNWHGLAALDIAADHVLGEGVENVLARHTRVAEVCRRGIRRLSLELYPADEAFASPTVTAVRLPPGVDWPAFNRDLRRHGVVVGGNYGALAGKVFRIGHMGAQADEALVDRTLEALAACTSAAV